MTSGAGHLSERHATDYAIRRTSACDAIVFDSLLTALLHGLTWSVQQRDTFEVTVSNQLLCHVRAGRFFSRSRELSINAVLARASSLLAAG